MNYNFTTFQRLWIDALKSGRFHQGSQRLHTINKGEKIAKYCCLGLACKLASSTGELKLTKTVDITRKYISSFVRYDGEGHCMPESVLKLLKLRNSIGGLEEGGVIEGKKFFSLTAMNDSYITFKEIGEYIESNPETVFER